MKLIEIDKSRYRQHLNRVIIGFIATLLALSLLFGSALIAAFGHSGGQSQGQVVTKAGQTGGEQAPGKIAGQESDALAANEADAPASTGNFRYNLLGVILALLACGAILHSLKDSRYFYEIYYVWQLKQLQNLIYRRLAKIKQAAANGDGDALVVLDFYYAGLKQVYLLDDNTLTLGKLEQDIAQLNQLADEHGIRLEAGQFNESVIKKF